MRGRHTFHAMGCEVVVAGATAAERDAVERLFDERDRVFSRFRADSELNRVNASAGAATHVSAELARMLGIALDAALETGGLVDPTLGAQLEAAGYDADFASLRPGPRRTVPRSRAPVRLLGRTVVVPRGVRLDLNGVVKGQTVDDALALLAGDGFVSAGGDLAARGGLVAALPGGGTVRLLRGALATSGTDRRRWERGGAVQHHLIDPRTGTPSGSPWVQVTTCGRTCVGADVAAKAAFLLGPAGPAWLDARAIPGRFLDRDGAIVVNDAWRRSLVPEAACT
jgi:thiamine biosynthesis lipoprotein